MIATETAGVGRRSLEIDVDARSKFGIDARVVLSELGAPKRESLPSYENQASVRGYRLKTSQQIIESGKV